MCQVPIGQVARPQQPFSLAAVSVIAQERENEIRMLPRRKSQVSPRPCAVGIHVGAGEVARQLPVGPAGHVAAVRLLEKLHGLGNRVRQWPAPLHHPVHNPHPHGLPLPERPNCCSRGQQAARHQPPQTSLQPEVPGGQCPRPGRPGG